MTIDRIGPATTAGERQMLREFLDYHRATLALLCEGLDDEQLRRTAVPTSSLTLLGLVRHLAEVERTWFRRVMAGEEIPYVWSPEGDFQVAFAAEASSRSEAFAAWQREVEESRRIEAAADSLDVVGYFARWDENVSLRLVMIHVLTEYTRHNGHADLIREAVDGVTGV